MKKMQIKNRYMVDKTESLEKGIAVFPSVYIEGSAACGKTTAVRMLLKKHPEIQPYVLEMDRLAAHSEKFVSELAELQCRMEGGKVWGIFENFPGELSSGQTEMLTGIIEQMPESCKIIFVSRERPPEELLELLWKRKLELIPMQELLFSREEIQKLIMYMESALSPEAVYQVTGGWAGCVDMVIRQSLKVRLDEITPESAGDIRKCYEIDTYIRNEILDALSTEEQKILSFSMDCPWINVELCESIWGIEQASDVLERLERKGLILYDRRKNCWKTASLFRKEPGHVQRGKELGNWYEEHGFIREALQCLKQLKDKQAYHSCMIAHYEQVPFLGVDYSEVMNWPERRPELCYLRGMQCYSVQNLEEFRKEIQNLEKMQSEDEKVQEILLNLAFVNPDVTLDEWLAYLETLTHTYPGMRLYDVLGNSVTFLCGLRDLSGLFACAKKEENRKGKIWKECLGEEEWRYYQLARLDYYLETERLDAVPEKDRILLMQGSLEGEESWQCRLVRMYLLSKLQRLEPDEENVEQIHFLEESLMQEQNPVCIRNAEAVSCLYSPWYQGKERLSRWLRHAVMDASVVVNENNYMMFACRAKGYVLLNQYERAEKILRKTIPYVQIYRRSRIQAEQLFLRAIVYWGKKRHGQALRDTIESFLISGEYRYVGFYAGYGEKGRAVLETYIEWMRNNRPEGWHRKKKYNYGNVLRMPLEDYMEMLLRCAKREARTNQQFPDEYIEECLTMMETIILQDIGRGLSNAEIGQELNLKISTVKSHIYSLYKKLGVNSRMQSVIKGKELGILE